MSVSFFFHIIEQLSRWVIWWIWWLPPIVTCNLKSQKCFATTSVGARPSESEEGKDWWKFLLFYESIASWRAWPICIEAWLSPKCMLSSSSSTQSRDFNCWTRSPHRSLLRWNLCDPQIIILSLGVLCIYFLYVCKIPSDKW